MITTTLSAFNLCKSQVIALGRQLENNYRQIVFDCSDFSEEITAITLVHQRKDDTAPYIVATSTGDALTWTITDTDTAYYGYGKGELRITFDSGLAKSIVFTTMVIKSITADTTIPQPLQSWYDAMIDYIDEHSISPEELGQAIEDYLEEHPIQAPVTSVNGDTGDVVITAADLGALTVELDPVFGASAAAGITSADITAWNGKYTKPSSGIPATDLTSTVQSRLLKTGGTTGQVLAKKSNSNYDTEWVNQSGGGGAVDSVNGQTGTVVLDADDVGALPDTTTASDLGAYVKPTNGIPKTDLDSAVQTSLGKADTALQSAPVNSVDGKTGTVTVIPTGGATGQVLAKASATDRDVEWITPSGGGLTQAQIDALNGMFRICAYSEDAASAYLAFCSAFGIVIYSITNNLTHATNSNSAVNIASGNSYTATITADSGYEIDTVTVMMGGVDVTASVYADGEINIPTVTGNISITVTTVTGWILVKSLSSSDLYQGGLGNTNPYYTSRNDRVCYQDFIPAPYGGYVFKAEWESSGTDTIYCGINSYNATADSAVSGGTAIGNSNTKSHSWYTSGTEFTMEELLNNLPITTIRINWSCGANHSTAVTPAQIDNVKIYCKQA